MKKSLRLQYEELLTYAFATIIHTKNYCRGGGVIWLCTRRSRKYCRPESNAATTKTGFEYERALTIADFVAKKIHEPLG